MPAPRDDQIVGGRFLCGYDAAGVLRRDWTRRGLYDEQGFGKCLQTMLAMDHLDIERAVIVGPAKAHRLGVWQGEFKKWSRRPRRIVRARDESDIGLWRRGRADVLLLSYEGATRWKEYLRDLVDLIVFDEAHRLKNSTAQRTVAALGASADGTSSGKVAAYGAYAARAWFLTGTPMAKDPSDIWTMARFCRATPLSHKEFCTRYFRKRVTTYGVRYTPLEEMTDELGRVIASFSLRRLTQDLPPLWITEQTLDGDTSEVVAMLRQYPGLEEAIVEAVAEGGLRFLTANHVSTLRRLIGEAKAPIYGELLVEELFDNDSKRVVMGIHTKAMDIVAKHLKTAGIGYVRVDGRSSEENDRTAIDRFQNDPACRVFLGQIVSAGEASTLTAAADLDLFEQSWSPKDNSQAIKRIHRTGQEHACRARLIVLQNSIDERVVQVVNRATQAILKVENAALAHMGSPTPAPRPPQPNAERLLELQRIMF